MKERPTPEEIEKIRMEKEKEEMQQRIAQEEAEEAMKRAKTDDKEETVPQMFKAKNKDQDWQKIVEDYTKQFGEPRSDGVLVFSSQEAVTKFCTEQAEKGRKFLLEEIDANNNPTGHYEFSCGDGKLHEGSLEKIRGELTKDLETASEQNQQKIKDGISIIDKLLNPKPNPAQTARKALQAMTGEDATLGSTAPNPLSTKPKMTPE